MYAYIERVSSLVKISELVKELPFGSVPWNVASFHPKVLTMC